MGENEAGKGTHLKLKGFAPRCPVSDEKSVGRKVFAEAFKLESLFSGISSLAGRASNETYHPLPACHEVDTCQKRGRKSRAGLVQTPHKVVLRILL